MARKKTHYAWVVLVACCALTSGLGILISSAGQWFAPVTGELGFSVTELTLYMSVCCLGFAVVSPFVGRVLAKVNVRLFLTLGYAICIATQAAMSFFNAPWQWWISGAVLGFVGGFVFMIPTPIILGNWFAKKTGLAVSIAMSCSGIAAAIMNPIAAALIAGVGWRTSYLIAAAIAAVIVLPCTLFLIRFKPEDKGLLPYGIDEASESGAEEATSIMAEGVPARRAFRSPSFWLLALVLAMIAILSSFSQLLPVYMETIGMVAMVGLIASMAMIGQFVGTLGLGAVSDRFGGTATGLVGFAIAGVGFLLLIFFGQMVFGDLAGGVLYGAALALGSVAPPLLCRNAYGNRDFAKLYSSLMLVINGMAFVGMPLLSLTLDLTGSFYPALWLGFVLCVVAIPTLMASMGIAKRLPREGGAEEEVQKEGGALEETVVA